MNQPSLKLRIRHWARNLHITLSLFGLSLMLFFAVTGFMLNHSDWFNLETTQTRTISGDLPLEMIKEPDKLAIVEKLRKDLGITGAMDSFSVDVDELRVVFKSPGREFEAVISRDKGHVEVTEEWHGLADRIAQLHRGSDTGFGWHRVIDAMAILLTLTIITGIALWLCIPDKRVYGIAAIVVCLLTCGGIYFFMVP